MKQGNMLVKLAFAAFLLITLGLWIASKSSVSALFYSPETSLAQIAGLFGVTALAFNFLLASRFFVLDKLMGGLDKVFKFHKFTGKLAFTLMLAHPAFLIAAAPQFASIYLFPQPGFSSLNFGILALWVFILLIIATLFIKMPYHIWKRTHQMMGIPFGLVALHVATVESDVAHFMPLRAWILGLTLAGLAVYVYKVFLYRWIGPKFAYTVKDVVLKGDITEILLTPVKRALIFRPGQFVFLSLGDKNIGKEEHPFSISSKPGDKNLRLSIKASGDYTARLKSLKSGITAKVYGPYGRFGESFLERNQESIWIAGGIGVTPFLSMMQYSAKHRPKSKVTMIYSCKNEADMAYREELAAASQAMKNMRFVPHYSDETGYLNADVIEKESGGLLGKKIFLCGPPIMMKTLSKAFVERGVPRRNIIFEDFSLR